MQKIDYGLAEVWRETLELLRSPGLLLVSTDTAGKPNTMAIGWATLGIVWSKPILTVFVRPSRFTFQLVESANDFTVNVPSPKMADIVEYCGTVSGRDFNKFEERQLTAKPARLVSSPVIDECLLHYECKVVQKNDVIPQNFTKEIIESYYAQGNFHRVYFGEVVAVYGVPDFREQVRKLPL